MKIKLNALGRQSFEKDIQTNTVQEFLNRNGEKKTMHFLTLGIETYLKKEIKKLSMQWKKDNTSKTNEEAQEIINNIPLEIKERVKKEKVEVSKEGVVKFIRENFDSQKLREIKTDL
jgi:hypothetical protein